jgi:hypothetical protein
MNIVVFLLFCYGFSNIVVYSAITESFRDFMEKVSPDFFGVLFNCMMCTGYWSGVIGYWLFYVCEFDLMVNTTPVWYNHIGVAFIFGCVASGTSWAIKTVLSYLESKEMVNLTNAEKNLS